MKEYIQLAKPRLTALVIISGLFSFFIACKSESFFSIVKLIDCFIILSFWGIACNSMNQVIEHKLDAKMPRTASRPIPSGKISFFNGLVFSIVSLFLAYFYTLAMSSGLVLMLSLLTYISYIFIYTPMKTKNPLNTIVGAFPGAFPVLMGWAIAVGNLSHNLAWILFLILFFWQLPHFFALAWMYQEEYRAASYQMISNYDKTGKLTLGVIFLGNISLIAVSFLPIAFIEDDISILFYFVFNVMLNTLLLLKNFVLYKDLSTMRSFFLFVTMKYLLVLLLFIFIFV